MAGKVVAAVLCGGRGERLRPLTDFFQKTMVPIGPNKRPLLEYIVRLLEGHGVKDVVLLTGYRSEDIRQYFGNGSGFGLNIRYSEDPPGLKGSLNAMSNAVTNGTLGHFDELLVYYGDVLSDLDVTALLVRHREEKADVTLVLAEEYRLPVGVARVEGHRVVGMEEKPKMKLSVTTGCMVIDGRLSGKIVDLSGGRRTDLMSHFVPELLEEGRKVAAYYTRGHWFDVGTLANYEKINSELASGKVKLFS
jgi:mannose-1-phosphate guanylyltransferase